MTLSNPTLSQIRGDLFAQPEIAHFNNSGASLSPGVVLSAITDYLYSEATIGGYETAVKFADALNETYQSIASLIGCNSSDVAFVDSATRGFNTFMYSFPFKRGVLSNVPIPAEHGVSEQIQLPPVVSWSKITGPRARHTSTWRLWYKNILTFPQAKHTLTDMQRTAPNGFGAPREELGAYLEGVHRETGDGGR